MDYAGKKTLFKLRQLVGKRRRSLTQNIGNKPEATALTGKIWATAAQARKKSDMQAPTFTRYKSV